MGPGSSHSELSSGPAAPATDVTLTQVGLAPPNVPVAGPPEQRRRRWWVVLLGLLVIVLLVALIVVATERGEERATRPTDGTTASVPTTVAPGGSGAPIEAPSGTGAPSAEPSGEPALPPGEPPPEPGGEAPAEVVALAAPTNVGIDSQCEPISAVEEEPCTITVHWVDNATDETGYRVEVESPRFGTKTKALPADTTSTSGRFFVDETVCFTIIAVRGDEAVSSEQQCVTTSL